MGPVVNYVDNVTIAPHFGEYDFTGKKISQDTGLVYFGARWYDPEVGRFITEDPIKAGSNWYAYCYDNPVKYVDPMGLDVGWYGEDDCGGASGYNQGDSKTTFSYEHTSNGGIITQRDLSQKTGLFGFSYWHTDSISIIGVDSNGNTISINGSGQPSISGSGNINGNLVLDCFISYLSNHQISYNNWLLNYSISKWDVTNLKNIRDFSFQINGKPMDANSFGNIEVGFIGEYFGLPFTTKAGSAFWHAKNYGFNEWNDELGHDQPLMDAGARLFDSMHPYLVQ